jgi:PhzF family phenazine biosynthesis protein
MDIRLFQIDAFTDQIFSGNPACVVALEHWLDDSKMLAIAAENAVAETAFIIQNQDRYSLRWFTPDIEMDLCGHATLASAHAVFHHLHPSWNQIYFDTLSGPLLVTKKHNGYEMDLPNRQPVPDVLPLSIEKALSQKPSEVLKARDYVLVYPDESTIRNLEINRPVFDQINLGTGGIVVTAPGTSCDFVSRFFTPQSTILEDPVTGSAHCSLVPYWSDILGKIQLSARQISERGGALSCRLAENRVLITGDAKTFLEGYIHLV